MADANTAAGYEFLDALARYVEWRLADKPTDPPPTDYAEKFGAYLDALGAGRKPHVRQNLFDYMAGMKDSGRVPSVREP